MNTEAIRPDVVDLGILFDDGGYGDKLIARERAPDASVVFLASTSRVRDASLRHVLDESGLSVGYHVTSGPADEIGQTPADKALHKAKQVASAIARTGYFDRHPAHHVTVFSADNEDWVPADGGQYSGKAHTEDDFRRNGEEWERAARGELPVENHAGYAAVHVLGGRAYGVVYRHRAIHTPMDPAYIQRAFASTALFEATRQNAHSLHSRRAIKNGALEVRDARSGILYQGQAAIDVAYGAFRQYFGYLLQSMLPFIRR